MKSRFWKIGIAWCCVLLYLVIGTITLDCSDSAEASVSGQVSLLDSLDEYVLDSVVGCVSGNETTPLLGLAQGDSKLEIGLSIASAAPSNFTYSDFKVLELAPCVFNSTAINVMSTPLLPHSVTTGRGPPRSTPADQLSALRTIILNL